MRNLGLRDPAFLTANSGALWTPAAITTALWLDAADATTITTVGGAVSQWNDKSGNGRNATQPTSSRRPAYSVTGLNSRGLISFDGVDDILGLTDQTLSQNTGAISYFFVARPNAPGDTQFKAVFDSSTNPGTDRASIYFRSNVIEAGGRRLDADSYQFLQVGSTTATACIGAAVYNYAAGTLGASFNGSDLAFRSGGFQTAGNTSNTQGAIGIGASTSTDAFTTTSTTACSCAIAEFIATRAALSTANRQIIEGYLAYKWGLTALLPSNHPYKSSPPTL